METDVAIFKRLFQSDSEALIRPQAIQLSVCRVDDLLGNAAISSLIQLTVYRVDDLLGNTGDLLPGRREGVGRPAQEVDDRGARLRSRTPHFSASLTIRSSVRSLVRETPSTSIAKRSSP